MKRLAPALAALLIGTSVAYGADATGKFAMKGVGLATCQVYVTERAKRSELYILFTGWLDGYMSALNQLSAETFDIAPWESTDLLSTVVENHCKKHPDHGFMAVVRSMFEKMRDQRLRRSTPLVPVGHQTQGFLIYEETMRRVQRELTKHRLYKGEVDGRYGEAVQKALEQFQRQSNLPLTGLPDQVTLWKLFRPGTAGRP